jgi:hypothetical protein
MKKLTPYIYKNANGYWASVDDGYFYVETKEYTKIDYAIKALSKIFDAKSYKLNEPIIEMSEENESI